MGLKSGFDGVHLLHGLAHSESAHSTHGEEELRSELHESGGSSPVFRAAPRD